MMSTNTVTDLSAEEWAGLKAISKTQHNTVYDGENSGTATTDTPGLGKTVVGYSYDPGKKTAEFTIKEKPESVPAEVIWFALGATVAHVSGAAARTY
ncbi:hypothetical protein CA233_15510 [Sphingomonas sp. ABOLD]|nr:MULTISPECIES: hypothetical protein [Sphingomonas]RSV38783.1 hypothetical protein CA234_15490 [Sphingomonas sp. ABOLE]RSV44140.1 hypothetical protein CA233_15510 [Sphingomonas sp. ABOLD]